MTMNEFAGAAHNRPTIPAEAIVAEFQAALDEYLPRRAEFIGSAQRREFRDRDDLGDAADVIQRAGQFTDILEALARDRREPARELGQRISNALANFVEPMEAAIDAMRDRQKVFRDQEKARADKQRAEQIAAERRLAAERNVEIAPPSARSAEPPRRTVARGNLGARVIETTQKTYAISDISKIPMMVIDTPKVREAILAVAKDLLKHMDSLPGITVGEYLKDIIR